MNADPLVTPSARARRRAPLVISVLAVTAAAFGVGFAVTTKPGEAVATSDAATGQVVTVARAEIRAFTRHVPLSGEARPRKDVRVFAPASGVRILELLVEQGDMVKAGQPLARLDTALVAAQTASQEASVAEARANQIRSADAYKRALSIKDSGALSTEQLEQREADAKATGARLAAAEAQLNEFRSRLQGGYVRAPQAGLVIERPAQLGSLVDGQMLFRLAGDNALEVAAEVAEVDMLALKVGQTARFKLMDGTEVDARLRRPPAAIDSRSRTGTALFDLPRDPRLRSGMFLRGDADLPPQQQLSAPQSAIIFEGAASYVFVVDDQNIARKTAVELGDRDGDLVAIRTGIPEGVRIAVGGAAFLQDGDKVRPVDPDAPAPPETAAASGRKDG
jgi:HlyD family secretion protein